jgi:RHS repeat-associated protein
MANSAPGANQTFLYDKLNRLTLATENPSNSSSAVCPDGGSQWFEQFGYDNYGNRTVAQSSHVGIVSPAGISVLTNRITDSGWGYDHSANLNQDMGAMLTYKYDAENRLVAACAYSDGPLNCTNQAASGRTLYGYDGDGRRVTKQTYSATVTTYIYDGMGNLAAEHGGTSATNGPEFLTADHLGSTRVLTNAAQGIVSRHDFRPFGDEILAGIRQGITGYNQDGGVRQEFTGKERDAETGLDYFGARYMSSAQGRFTSPDRPFADQHVANTQSWNLYSYTRNNPLSFVDENGFEVRPAEFAAAQKQIGSLQAGDRYTIAFMGVTTDNSLGGD